MTARVNVGTVTAAPPTADPAVVDTLTDMLDAFLPVALPGGCAGRVRGLPPTGSSSGYRWALDPTGAPLGMAGVA
jgi:hypothetical protein